MSVEIIPQTVREIVQVGREPFPLATIKAVPLTRGRERFYRSRRRGGRSPRCPHCQRSVRTGHRVDCLKSCLSKNLISDKSIRLDKS